MQTIRVEEAANPTLNLGPATGSRVILNWLPNLSEFQLLYL